jgi:hypothetical protein
MHVYGKTIYYLITITITITMERLILKNKIFILKN